jgi:hypothetical protein
MQKSLVGLILALTFFIFVALPILVKGESYIVKVTIAGLPRDFETGVYLDGVYNGTIRGGESRSFNITVTAARWHQIVVDYYVPSIEGIHGTRFYCKDNSWSFSGPGEHTFTYVTQYYLTVTSQHGVTSGSGWYDEGMLRVATISADIIPGASGTRYKFKGWGGDASGSGLTSNEILMDGPKNAVAIWITQYFLDVSSNLPSIKPKGSDWYDEGFTASFSVENIVSSGEGTRYVFSSWSGDYEGSEPQGTITMNGPKKIVANFRTEYYVAIEYNPREVANSIKIEGEGWHIAGESKQLGPVPQQIEVSPTRRYVFLGWDVNGEKRAGPMLSIQIDAPLRVKVLYGAQYYLHVVSSYGKAHGEGWYSEGERAQFWADPPEQTGFVIYKLHEWTSTPKAIMKKVDDTRWEIIMNRDYVVEAQWIVDYSPLITLVSSILLLSGFATATIVILIKRPKVLSSLSSAFRRRPKAEYYTTIPRGAMIPCVACGAPIIATAHYCDRCGAPQVTEQSELDERVYDYIVKHEGTISLSQAAKDLGISIEELQAATERLKRQRRLA